MYIFYLQLNRGNAHRCIVLTAVLDDGHTVNFSQIPDRNIVETMVNGETFAPDRIIRAARVKPDRNELILHQTE